VARILRQQSIFQDNPARSWPQALPRHLPSQASPAHKQVSAPPQRAPKMLQFQRQALRRPGARVNDRCRKQPQRRDACILHNRLQRAEINGKTA